MKKNIGSRRVVGITIRKETWQKLSYLKYKHGFETLSDLLEYMMKKTFEGNSNE